MEDGGRGGGFTDSHTEMLSSSRAEIRTNANDSADPSLLRVRVSDTVEHHRGWKCTKEGGQILSMLRRHHTDAEANWMTVINPVNMLIKKNRPFQKNMYFIIKWGLFDRFYIINVKRQSN